MLTVKTSVARLFSKYVHIYRRVKMTPKNYLKKILSQGCIITGETGPHVVPHHPKSFKNGAGKVSDFLAIPMVSRLHTLQDDSLHLNKPL